MVAEEYKELVTQLKDMFAKVVPFEEYFAFCGLMRGYLERYPVLTERLVWQKAVNEEIGYPYDYDFDYGGKGPSHIRWGLTLC